MDAVATASMSSLAPNCAAATTTAAAASPPRTTGKILPSLLQDHLGSSLRNCATRVKYSSAAGLGVSLPARKDVAEAGRVSALLIKNRKIKRGAVGQLRTSFLRPLPNDKSKDASLACEGTRTSVFQRVRAAFEEQDVPLGTSNDLLLDQQKGASLSSELEGEEWSRSNVGGFAPDSPYKFDLTAAAAGGGANAGSEVQVLAASQALYQPRLVWFATSEDEERQYIDRAINASIVGAAGAFAITKILTVDQDYWHGWTIFEILKYAPVHNWSAYEEALKDNPVLAKMMISGIVYSVGDWIAQCYEGKPILDISRDRMMRSGLVGFCLHGSLSHFYYHLCEAIFPFQEWWVVPLKVAFDQTVWSAVWNSIYFVTLGLLRLESPANIAAELKSTFWPLLTAGWKLWPFAHIITYGVVPVEQRLLWVDCVELVWVTILSMYSNEKAEARILEAATESAMEAGTSSESEGKFPEGQ